MSANRVQCSECHFSIVAAESADWIEQECPSCKSKQSALIFPAIRGISAPSLSGTPKVTEGLAACFFHAAKPAVIPCDVCGRFLCGLCDLKIGESHLCTLCLQSAQDGKTPADAKPLTQVKEQTYLHQNMALILTWYAPISIVGLYVMFLTAPAAIFISIRYWNHPGGIQQRGKWRFILSILMGLTQIVCVIALAAVIYAATLKVTPKP
jgi:hypothetical protein